MDLFGRDMFGNAIKPKAGGPLEERFAIPPFSVLDARQGYWQERKRAWLSYGLKSEIGRGSNLLERSDESQDFDHYRKVNGTRKSHTGASGRAMELAGGESASHESGTSIFDPVLCELAYAWFSPPNGQILDPFAGGSVRGIVAGIMGRAYHGIDLRAEQIAANRQQAADLAQHIRTPPAWECADSSAAPMPAADLVFSCPPYADLEVYSDHPADLSNMDYDRFRAAYAGIIARAVAALHQDRFALFVVGDLRDKRGIYRNFPAHTIEAFEAAGARLYNEAILLTSVGSLPLRVSKQFTASRKLGKTHQNVYVFVKGDPRKAADACGEILV